MRKRSDTDTSLARKGDAGAWVIDDDSRVCGYIVSSDVSINTTYVCPMEAAIENIKITLRASIVSLPGLGALLPDTSVEASTNLNTAKVEIAVDSRPIGVEETTNPLAAKNFVLGLGKASHNSAWFCSECNDGPYEAWQITCQSCQHAKCNSCKAATGNTLHPTIPKIKDTQSDNHSWSYGGASMDFGQNRHWFCCECNDGPYSDWQGSCQNCKHAKCQNCRLEKAFKIG